jgi:hypothetical protein
MKKSKKPLEVWHVGGEYGDIYEFANLTTAQSFANRHGHDEIIHIINVRMLNKMTKRTEKRIGKNR